MGDLESSQVRWSWLVCSVFWLKSDQFKHQVNQDVCGVKEVQPVSHSQPFMMSELVVLSNAESTVLALQRGLELRESSCE